MVPFRRGKAENRPKYGKHKERDWGRRIEEKAIHLTDGGKKRTTQGER